MAKKLANIRTPIRVEETCKLTEIAELHCGDKRLTALLQDLNPHIQGRTCNAGITVVLPALEEAQKFAAMMGFSLGFDPSAARGTAAMHNWRRLQEGEAAFKLPKLSIDPAGIQNPQQASGLHAEQANAAVAEKVEQLAGALLEKNLPPAVVASRLAAAAPASAIKAFVEQKAAEQANAASADIGVTPPNTSTKNADELAEVAAHAEAIVFQEVKKQASIHLQMLEDVLRSTRDPEGRVAFLEALCGNESQQILQEWCLALACPRHALIALLDAAPQMHERTRLAKQGARLSAGAFQMWQESGIDEMTQRWAQRLRDQQPIYDDAELVKIGILEIFDPIDDACQKLISQLEKRRANVERAPHIIMYCLGQPANFYNSDDKNHLRAQVPPLWMPFVEHWWRLGEALLLQHAGQRRRGLGGLALSLVQNPYKTAPTMTAGEIAAAASMGAKRTDEEKGLAQRLAPWCVAYFSMFYPLADQGLPSSVKRQRRQDHFRSYMQQSHLVAATQKAGLILQNWWKQLDTTVQQTADQGSDISIARACKSMHPEIRKAAEHIAVSLSMSSVTWEQPISEIARAILAMCIASDVELRGQIIRESARKKIIDDMQAFAAPILQIAVQLYSDGETRSQMREQMREQAKENAASSDGRGASQQRAGDEIKPWQRFFGRRA